MYEVTTIGGIRVPSSPARPIGALPSFDLARYQTKEAMTAAAVGLIAGLVIGALLASR